MAKKVKAIITLSNDGTKTILKDKNQYYSNILYPKTLRYCTGIKTETMITKR